jgi:flagellar basal-body rod protein FlgB
MIAKLDDYLRFNEAALSLRSQRQELIASNIANADTPNYKARDIDFASALNGVLGRAGASTAAQSGAAVLYRAPAQGAADGNTVDMDVERNQFADNAIRYEASITLMNAQIKHMLAALQGG